MMSLKEPNLQLLNAKYIATPGKEILAGDGSTGTIRKRLSSINVENIELNHQALRELLFTSPNTLPYLSGVILFEETLYLKTSDGKPFVYVLPENGPSIMVDKGTVELAGTNGEIKKPRELPWVTGVVLGVLATSFGITGNEQDDAVKPWTLTFSFGQQKATLGKYTGGISDALASESLYVKGYKY
ncbi:aldolase [Lithospermum erythrorhizon]|uniref:fructose-bisphosphate aldolase n=1 Tax=Lithospermum erythrorhizon TaxID=34254 RepID=A0AAV3P310_LITER